MPLKRHLKRPLKKALGRPHPDTPKSILGHGAAPELYKQICL